MSGDEFVGRYVECFTLQGDPWGYGKVFAYFDAPTVAVEREDGSRFSWRADLTRLAPEPPSLGADTAHAVALEREVIAAWLEARGWNLDKAATMPGAHLLGSADEASARAGELHQAAWDIRNGAHNQEAK